jgi:hypothetical protein
MYDYVMVDGRKYRIHLGTGAVELRAVRSYPRWVVSWRGVTDERLALKVLVCAAIGYLDREGA